MSYTLIGAGGGQALDAANILKPALARGVLKVANFEKRKWPIFLTICIFSNIVKRFFFAYVLVGAVHWCNNSGGIQEVYRGRLH